MKTRKILASLLCALYITYCCPAVLLATEITGVVPVGNVYTIEAEKVSGDTGFRQYDTFQLSDGDIADLVFYGSYDKFINMVDSQVRIDGIVNTVKNDAFFDGRAIFVSPSGIIVGASGVLNVGSLNLLSTSSDQYGNLKDYYDKGGEWLSYYHYNSEYYKDLVTAATGEVIVNGIVLSRDEVIADGGSVQVTGQVGENGIVAGWTDSTSTFTEQDDALAVFQSLVSGNLNSATYLSQDEKGVIRLTASTAQSGDSGTPAPDNGITASVDLTDTVLVSNEIDINAKSELGSATLPIVAFGDGVYFDYSKSRIGIKNSTLSAGDVDIRSESETASTINAVELPEVILAWIMEAIDDPEQVEENIASLLSSEVYDDFAGSRSYSYVDIDGSTIAADNNLSVTTDAKASYVVKTTGLPEEIIPFQSMFHSLGTETESIINVKNSSDLSATSGTADLKALSGNSLQMQVSNDNGLFKFSETDAFSLQFLNFSTSVDTELNITDSSLTANEISARTLSNTDNFVFVDNSATVLKNDFSSPTEGGSGAAVIAIVNNSKTKNEVNITNSTLEATGADKNLSIEAVSVQNIDVTGKTRTDAAGAKEKEKIEKGDSFFSKMKDRFSKFSKIGKEAYTKYQGITYNSWFGLFKKIYSYISGTAEEGAQQAVGEAQELDPGLFQVGGSFLFSNSTNDTAVNITDSTLTSAQDIDVASHILDKYHNVALAHAKEPEDASQSTAIVGAGVALVVNNRNNTNNILIDDSRLESRRDVNLNAITELPGNGGNVGLTSNYLVLGLGFNSSATDDWDFTFNKDIGPDSDRESMTPTLGMTGFFNNAAAAGTTGDDLAVAASVTYNNGKNTTTVDIKNGSKIYALDGGNGGNVRANAANSVATRSDAGFFGSSSIVKYDESYDVWNSDGTGASVLVQAIENNAEVNIEDSEISAVADVGLNAASEQSYINFIKMFTDAPTIALGGAVSVQDYTGTTGVNILPGSSIVAEDILVQSGKARVSIGQLDFSEDKKGLPVIENDRLVLEERRTAEDHITTVDIVGELSKQESEEQKEVTAAVGAAVNVHTIDREVNAIVDDAVLHATKDVKINSVSFNRNVELALAGSLAGGAAAQTQNVANWQKKADTSDKSKDFFDQMLAKIDEAFPEEEEIEEIKDGVDAAKDAAQNVGGSKYSFAIAGSVNVINNDTKVHNYVRNGAIINAKENLELTSDLKNIDVILSGGLAKSGTVGTGAAVNLLSRGGSVSTTVGGTVNDNSQTTIKSGTKTTVDANEDNEIVSIAVGVGYTGDDTKPTEFDGAIGGSFAYNALESTITSIVTGTTVIGNSDEGTDVSVHANQNVDTLNFTGALAVEEGSKFSAGAALSGTADYMKSTVGAGIGNTDLTDGINNVTVLAEEDDDLLSIGISLEAVGNYAKYGTPFDGSLGLVYLENDIYSVLENSQADISGKLDIAAENQVKAVNAQGDGAFSGATSGVGVGGGWIFDIQANTVNASLDPDTKTIKANGISVAADSFETINNIPITVGISKTTSMLASTVVVDLISNEVAATAKGKLESGADVDVNAKDETYLLTRGGTLAAAGGQATAVLGASVNVDKLSKKVEATLDGADVNSSGDTTISAESVDAMGGTRKDDGTYDRDDISNPDYQDKLLKYDDESGQYTDLNRDDVDNSFLNWNMFYNLGFGAKSAFTGAVVVKLAQNDVNAELRNESSVNTDNLNVLANERIVKNLLLGSISATQNLGVGAQVVYTKDAPKVNALIADAAKVTAASAATVAASDVKDNNTVEVAGQLSTGEGGSVGANVVLNVFEDEVIAKIDSGSTLDVYTLSMDADEDVNSTRVLVQASASQNVAVSVEPLVNDYKENVSATVEGATVNGSEDASSASIMAEVGHKTRDIALGVAAAAKGVTLSGIEIRNNYDNTVNSGLISSEADKLQSVAVDSRNYIYADNWAILLEGTGQGVEIGANVMINDVKSTTLAQIRNSILKASGDVAVRTNYVDGNLINDRIRNTTGSIGLVGQGAAADANLVLNTFTGVSKATVTGSGINAGSLSVNAGAQRSLGNTNITVVAAGEGAALGGSVTYNHVESDTVALVESSDSDITTTGDVKVGASDKTDVDNLTGTGAASAIGGSAMANVVIVKEKGLAKADIRSSGDGKFSVGGLSVKSELDAGVEDASVGVSLGIGALAGTVKLVTIGEKTDYTDLEKNAGLDSAVSGTDERVKNFLGRSVSEDIVSGSFADINADVTSSGNVLVEAESTLSGTGGDADLDLNNVDVSVSAGSAGVGILSLALNGNTSASISGGNISSGGNVEVRSEAEDSGTIKSTGLSVSGLSVSGGISSYNNNANSAATISDAAVTGQNISVSSVSSSHADVEIDGISLGGLAINVSGYETNVNYSSQALVSGKTDISTEGTLEISSAGSVDAFSGATFDAFTGGSAVAYMTNNVAVAGSADALIKDAEGSIDAGQLVISSEFGTMSAEAKNNVVAVSGIDITTVNGGLNLNPVFTSGIDNLGKNLTIKAQDTTISAGKGQSSNDDYMQATSGINGVGVSIVGFAQSQSQAKSNSGSSTLLKSDSFETGSLNIDAVLKADATASAGQDSIGVLGGVNSIEIDATATDTLKVELDGNIKVTGSANIRTDHSSQTSVAADTLNAGLFDTVSSLTLTGNNNSDTDVTIKGNFSATGASIEVNTDRTGSLNTSNRSGSAVSSSTRSFNNSVTGKTNLTLDGLKLSGDGSSDLSIKVSSANTHDDVSRSSNGGFYAYEKSDYNYEFDTDSNIDIKNTTIDNFRTVTIDSNTANTIKDSSVTADGGFIVITNSRAGHTFSSASGVNLTDSKISAANVGISSEASNSSDLDKEITFKAESGGFYTEDDLELDNTLNQKNEINISNTSISATGDATVALTTGQGYRQKVEDLSEGFIANPTIKSWLTSNNTNNLDIDKDSSIRADGALSFLLDVNGGLSTYSHVEIKDAGSDPATESYLTMNADNTMTLGGFAEGGNLNSVIFMGNSNNDLHQESYSEHYAVAPFTSEDGKLQRIINNTLAVTETGEAVAGKALDWQFNSGTGNIYASNHYHCVYYAAFGYETYGETSSNKTLTTNNTANVPGKITAGIGNSKFVFVGEDGNVDAVKSSGVYSSNFTSYGDGDDLTPAQVKQTVVGNFQNQVDDISDNLSQINAGIQDIEAHRDGLSDKKEAINDILDTVEDYKAAGYSLKTESEFMDEFRSDMLAELGKAENPISESEYSSVFTAYQVWLVGDEASAIDDLKDITYYVMNIDTTLSAAQKETFGSVATQMSARMSTISDAGGEISGLPVYTYGDHLMIMSVAEGGNDRKNYMAALEFSLMSLEDEISASNRRLQELDSARILAAIDLEALNTDLAEAQARPDSDYGQDQESYALLFHNLRSTPGSITITGVDSANLMVDGVSLKDDPSILSAHVFSPKNRFDVSNNSNRVIVLKDVDYSGNDSLRFKVNGEDFSEYSTPIDLVIMTNEEEVSFSDIIVERYGVIENSTKRAEIHNDSLVRQEGADLQLYTGKTGAFSFRMDASDHVTTSAPVVFSRPDLVVKSYLGYHSFETFAYSEASALASGFSMNLNIFPTASQDNEEKPVINEIRTDASAGFRRP